MKPLLIATLSTLLTACNTSTRVDLSYHYQEGAPVHDTITEAELCNDLGGDYELVNTGYSFDYRCVFPVQPKPKHCHKPQCKPNAVHCPNICENTQ